LFCICFAAEGEDEGDIIVTKTVKKISSVVSGSSTEGRTNAGQRKTY